MHPEPRIGSKLSRPTVLATAVILSGISLVRPAAAQEVRGLPEGVYLLRMKDSTATNPFGQSLITIASGGELLWERDGQPFRMMRWTQQADRFTVEDPEGCPLNPLGDYLVEDREGGGYQLKLVTDGCGDRSSSIAITYLMPVFR